MVDAPPRRPVSPHIAFHQPGTYLGGREPQGGLGFVSEKAVSDGDIRDRESNIHILGGIAVRAKWDVKKHPVYYKIT